METIFIKHFIKNEDSLPKVEGFYLIKEGMKYFNPNLYLIKEYWLKDVEFWLEEKPLPADEECVHPYHSVIGGDGQPEKCLKCGEILNQ